MSHLPTLPETKQKQHKNIVAICYNKFLRISVKIKKRAVDSNTKRGEGRRHIPKGGEKKIMREIIFTQIWLPWRPTPPTDGILKMLNVILNVTCVFLSLFLSILKLAHISRP